MEDLRLHELHEGFQVSSVTEPSAEIPETKVSVTCPVCNTPNTVTLPQGAKLIVTPPKLATARFPISDLWRVSPDSYLRVSVTRHLTYAKLLIARSDATQ